MFGVFLGGWLGLCEACDYFFSDRRLVKVPHVQLHIKVAVWSNMAPLIKSSLRISLRRYFMYIFLYFLFGGYVRSYVLAVTRLSMDEPLDTIVSLINISLAFRCILIGSACVFTLRLSDLLFQLYQIKVSVVLFKYSMCLILIVPPPPHLVSAHFISPRTLCG